jgi:uncharacterized phage protein (TIGR01671 family)
MRDIRFRAWDKKKKEMFYPTKLFFIDGWLTCIDNNKPRECNSELERIDETYYLESREPEFDAALMQFTGLLDKNGVEIYEGDIVRYDLGDREAELEGEENRYDYASVIFENGSFLSINHDGFSVDYLIDFSQEMEWEVIGNIHENPELLED